MVTTITRPASLPNKHPYRCLLLEDLRIDAGEASNRPDWITGLDDYERSAVSVIQGSCAAYARGKHPPGHDFLGSENGRIRITGQARRYPWFITSSFGYAGLCPSPCRDCANSSGSSRLHLSGRINGLPSIPICFNLHGVALDRLFVSLDILLLEGLVLNDPKLLSQLCV